jgi:peptidoglycan/LPS O-acetylase OafA/YrhL
MATLLSALPVAFILLWRHALILDPVTLTVGFTAIGVFSTCALLLAVLPGASPLWKALLQLPLLRRFGRYSYGLYLLHTPIASLLEQHHLLLPATTRLADLANLTFQIAVVYLAAFLSYHLFERRFLHLKRFFEPQPIPQPGEHPTYVPARHPTLDYSLTP